jgi:hypothetical protein
MTRRELPGSYEALPGALLGGTAGVTADWIVPAARLEAETPDHGKDLECASLPEAFGRADRAISEVMQPPLAPAARIRAETLMTRIPGMC